MPCHSQTGHPEGYLEAFANLYSDFALQNPGQVTLAPTVEVGARGVAFMFAALESSRNDGRFTPLAATAG